MDFSDLQNKNTKFSSLRGLDLRELLADIDNFQLIYRDILNLNTRLLFGLEIEWEGENEDIIREFLRTRMNDWRIDEDGSLNSGGEVKSPKLTDCRRSWSNLKRVCECLKNINAKVDERTGGHIHFGANIFGNDLEAFLVFLKTYAIYENIFFRFYYCEFLKHRKTSYTRDQKIAWKIRKNIDQINSIHDLNYHYIFLRNGRSYAINFGNLKFGDKSREKNTIELRIPNGSVEEVIWQNNVNAFGKFILKTIGEEIDRDFIEHEFLSITEDSINPLLYNEICLSKVLEFVDLIFDNDLDKYYFLKQYFKNYESNYGLKENRLAKRFIS